MTSSNIPATRKETAMWLLERLVPDTGVNNVATTFAVDGRLDADVLRGALLAVLTRYEVLRTVFATGDGDAGLTKRVLAPEDVAIDLTDIPVTAEGPAADLTAFVGAPFPVDGSLLVRAGLRAGPDGDVCCVVVHHLVFDAMSTAILQRELIAAYDALAAGGTPVATPVAATGERAPDESGLAYWRKNLDGLRQGGSGLWCAKPQAATASLRAETLHHELSAGARETIRRLRKELRASEAVVLLAAYYVLLAQHGAGDDVVIGTPVNVRDPASANAIGYHANLLPLRVLLDDDPDFAAVVKRTRNTFLEAIGHANVPLEQVSPDVIADAPGSWRGSFFRHLFNYLPGSMAAELTVAGSTARPVLAENGYSRFDLEFFFTAGATMTIRAAFCTDAFDAADVALLLARYDELLAGIGDRLDVPVSRLSAQCAADRVATAAPEPVAAPDSVVAAVAERVRTDAAAVAIVEPDRSVRYGELWSAALAVRELVGEAPTVALVAPRGADLAAGLLGSWLAGAKCVVLDPAQPLRDAENTVAESGARLVLTGGEVTVTAPPVVTVAAVPRPAGAATAAAVDIAGDAIAVAGQSHGALAASAAALGSRVDLTGAVLWLNSATTEGLTVELLAPLCAGGRVVVAPDEARTDGTVLANSLSANDIAVLHASPTVLRTVLEEVRPALANRTILSGHERLPGGLARQLTSAGAVVRHGFLTQAGYVSLGEADGDRTWATEGTPLFEVTIGGGAGIGVLGELSVAGAGTGESARWLSDGAIAVLGDDPELAAVETAFAGLADVAAVAAVATPVAAGRAVVVFAESSKPGVAAALRDHARTATLVPVTPVVLDALPVTLGGVVDRAALVRLAADAVAETQGTPADAESDELVATLVRVWCELLDRRDLAGDSNFFTSGGNSLLGAQLVGRIKAVTGMPVALADLFTDPTPRGLAEQLRDAMWDEDEDDD